MKKFLFLVSLFVLMIASATVSASAVTNGVVKVGLYYGSSALYSANAQVVTGMGEGFNLGYYDEDRQFVSLGYIADNSISVTPDGNIAYGSDGEITSGSGKSVLGGWHVQLSDSYADFDAAQQAAAAYGGYVACVDGVFYVRTGNYVSDIEAAGVAAGLGGTAVGPSSTGVTVTRRGEQTILFQFDYKGWYDFAVQAQQRGNTPTQTWFKAKKYYGGFQYRRISGSNSLYVCSVVELEDYIKCVAPYEMSNSWPLEALKAQAICARTYVMRVGERHSKYGFDVCATEDCQVYFGVDFQYKSHTDVSDEAVEATAGLCMYYDGKPIYAVYSASNGGASEDAKNVWGSKDHPYLAGKVDPYEASAASNISGYHYTVSYTASSLGSRMANRYSAYNLGTLASVYVSEYTPNGNVYAVTFVDKSGKSYTVKGETCRLALGTKSQRFTINGGNATRYFVNEGDTIASVSGSYVIGGDGSVSLYNDTAYVITSAGVEEIGGSKDSVDISGGILIEGTGNGHNVGMSQWGANAMAKQGYSYRDILNFYYTGITIE